MKKKLEKLMYIGFGSLIALGGYFLGTFHNNDVDAQLNLTDVEYDEIRCSSLRIVDDDGNTLLALGSNIIGDGGSVSVFGGGDVSIYKGMESWTLLARLGFDRQAWLNTNGRISRGRVSIHDDETQQMVAALGAGEFGGDLSVRDKSGELLVLLGVDSAGGGYVSAGYGTSIRDPDWGSVSLTGAPRGGSVEIMGRDGTKVALDNDRYGGRLTIFSRDNNNVLQSCVNSARSGSVFTWDQFGNATGGFPLNEGVKINKRLR